MENQKDAYAEYRERQLHLVELLEASSKVFSDLRMSQDVQNMKGFSEKVNNDNFKIQVVGTFKNGKSTFINAFLGDEILPAYAVPCTAVINEVKYGEEKKALLHFKSPLREQLPSGIPERVKLHMEQYQDEVPPIEIDYNEIEDYATIPIGEDAKEMILESPYEKIELFWPLELLENSVEIIDSPGLNEHSTRTKVTAEYLTKADAILFVLSADKLCANDEIQFIENNLRRQGFKDIFFVVNRFDTLRNDRDRQAVIGLAESKLRDYTDLGKDGIFFVSALNALDGKMTNNYALYQASGISNLEKALAKFLTCQKGNIKLRQPAENLKKILDRAVSKDIPQKENMLISTLEELNRRVEEQKPLLNAKQGEREQMATRIEQKISFMLSNITRSFMIHFDSIERLIPSWIDEYEPQNSISINPLKIKQGVENLLAEIIEYLQSQLEEEQLIFQETELSTLISSGVEDIRLSVEDRLEQFFIELDAIKINISGIKNPEPDDTPVWQRAAAAGVGFIATGFGGAALGGMNGFNKDFAKGLAVQFGAIVGLSILFPPAIFPFIIISIIKSVAGLGDNATNKVKEKLKTEMLIKIAETREETIEKSINQIRESIEKFGNEILGSMDYEIESVWEQVNSSIEDLNQEQEQIEQQKIILANSAEQMKEISAELKAFI